MTDHPEPPCPGCGQGMEVQYVCEGCGHREALDGAEATNAPLDPADVGPYGLAREDSACTRQGEGA